MILKRLIALAFAGALMLGHAAAQNSGGTSPLSVPKGGTGKATIGAHKVLFGAGTAAPTEYGCTGFLVGTGTSIDPTCRVIAGSDLPNPSGSTLGGIQSKTCSASQWLNVISTGGVPACAQPNFTDLAGNATAAQGGTGQTSYTIGDVLYASGSTALSKLAGNTTTTRKFLRQTGTGAASQAPAWDTLLAADVPGSNVTKTDDTNVTLTLGGTPTGAALNAFSMTLGWTGQLGVSRGGTGLASGTSGGVLCYTATGTLASSSLLTQYGLLYGGGAGVCPGVTSAGSDGQIPVGQTGAAPIFKTISGDVTFSAAGAASIGATKITSAMLNSDVFSTAHSWGGAQTFTNPIVGTQSPGDNSTKAASTAYADAIAALKVNLTRNVSTGCGLAGGGDLSSDRTLRLSLTVNPQTGTTYTVLDGDCGKVVRLNNASAVAVTLPQANGSTFISGWSVDFQNIGAGTATITPTTSTINGGSSIALTQNQGMHCVSDGTNYSCVLGVGSGAGAGTVTNVATGTGLTGGPITASGTIGLASASDKTILSNNSGGSAPPVSNNAATVGSSDVLLSCVDASSSATVDFNNLLTSAYTRYRLTVDAFIPATDDTYLTLRVGTGGTPTYQATGYVWGASRGVASAASVTFAGNSSTQDSVTTSIPLTTPGSGNGVDDGGTLSGAGGVTSTVEFNVPPSKIANFLVRSSFIRSDGVFTYFQGGGAWATGTTLTSLRLLMSAGNVATGKACLYGLRNN